MKNKRLLTILLLVIIASGSFGENNHECLNVVHNFTPSFIIVLLGIILAILGLMLYKHGSLKKSGIKPEELNEMSAKILSDRFAKGEISKKEYEEILMS